MGGEPHRQVDRAVSQHVGLSSYSLLKGSRDVMGEHAAHYRGRG